jgi:hypothetical protein
MSATAVGKAAGLRTKTAAAATAKVRYLAAAEMPAVETARSVKMAPAVEVAATPSATDKSEAERRTVIAAVIGRRVAAIIRIDGTVIRIAHGDGSRSGSITIIRIVSRTHADAKPDNRLSAGRSGYSERNRTAQQRCTDSDLRELVHDRIPFFGKMPLS